MKGSLALWRILIAAVALIFIALLRVLTKLAPALPEPISA